MFFVTASSASDNNDNEPISSTISFRYRRELFRCRQHVRPAHPTYFVRRLHASPVPERTIRLRGVQEGRSGSVVQGSYGSSFGSPPLRLGNERHREGEGGFENADRGPGVERGVLHCGKVLVVGQPTRPGLAARALSQPP